MHTRPLRPRRSWGRSMGRAVVIGAIAAVFVASAASAQPPYEPPETQHQGDYPDEPGYDAPPSGGSSSTGTTVPNGGASVPTGGCSTSFDEDLGIDLVKLTDEHIDFGDNTFLLGAPVGVGSVGWSILCGFYTPRLIGTLHLDGDAGQYGRMHISFWAAGHLVETRHSTTRYAPDKRHYHWSVDLAPVNPSQITEVHVCTETSDNGINFGTVSCKTRFL